MHRALSARKALERKKGCSRGPFPHGAYRDRTGDLRLAKADLARRRACHLASPFSWGLQGTASRWLLDAACPCFNVVCKPNRTGSEACDWLREV